jgi:AcrR family transcriptional regulator
MVSLAPDMRSAILAAATRLFAARGFDGTSVQDVADEVGVTKQAILHHFASKDLLRQAVLDAMLAHWKDTLPRLLMAATATEERFEAVFGELRRFFEGDPDRARLVMREALDRPHEMKKLMRGPVKDWLQAVAAYIKAGQGIGRHHADLDADSYVLHIFHLVLVTAASTQLTAAVIPDQDRYDAELVRIARSSLFVPARTKGKKRKGKH